MTADIGIKDNTAPHTARKRMVKDMESKKKLLETCEELFAGLDLTDVSENDTRLYEYLFENMSVTVQKDNRFFVTSDCDYITQIIFEKRKKVVRREWLDKAGCRDAVDATLFYGGMDYGHTCPDWQGILTLGICGLRQRAVDCLGRDGLSRAQKDFYSRIVRVYDAGLRYMDRAAQAMRAAGMADAADSLARIKNRPPQTLFEAIQTMVVFYMFQHSVECSQIRTFGRLDRLLLPYYEAEADKDAAARTIQDFMDVMQVMDPEAANIPFALGGLKPDGSDAVNELSYLFLSAYKRKNYNNIKVHIMCADSTPKAFIESALDGVRDGENSICFLSDETITESLLRIGAHPADARNYAILGCYEAAAFGEVACTSAGKLNLVKALELALFEGEDIVTGKHIGLTAPRAMDSFEDVFSAFETQIRSACREAMKMADYMETNSPRIHTAPFFSSAFDSSMEQGGDVFNDPTARYNNTSVIATGIATCVDSLAAIRKLVYEDGTLTLDALRDTLRSDWKDAEVLRQKIRNTYPKYGQGIAAIDAIAARIVSILSEEVNNRPNTKGGVFRLGVYSINWRWRHGAMTGASADGRRCGESLSLNTGASFGAARNGATAHLISVSRIGNDLLPNGSICDIDMHISAISGDNGLEAMYAAQKTFFDMGGFAVHYNVLDSEVLRKAKENPQLYPDLQVRLCGWNVRFSKLSEKEQDEFIERFDRAG